MGKVMLIPAKRQVGNNERAEENPRLRVAAYCRVSTDSDEQATSYDAQVKHYTEYIQRNPEWEFAGIYADDGISGTNTKKRNEFNRMIDDCMAGNIDMIITKSISRFARNTLDCLKYIRQLKGKNIPVYFEKESINTLDAKGEVLLTIMASLAQQESQSLSQNVKLGLQYRYQQGKVQVNHNRFLGYTKDENGHLIIDLEQAEIVKRIYREYLEGSSMGRIAAGLEKDGILTGAGNTKWHTSTINKILRNSMIGKRILASPHVEREYRFTVEIPAGNVKPGLKAPLKDESVIMQGAVDCAFEENGGIVIVDYKTDRVPSQAALWKRYKKQLALYKFAMEKYTGKNVMECLLYSFSFGTEVNGRLD